VIPTAVFFDMDDTLLDAVTAMQGAWEAVCGEHAPKLGCEPGALREAIRRESMEFWKDESKVEREWRTRLLDAREHCIRLALTAEGWDPAPARAMAEQYSTEHRARLRLFDDAVETIETLREAGFRLGLLTNGPRPLQRDKIERFGLEPYFDVIVIEGEFGHGKPHPEVFAHALRTVKAGPDQAWHIGDNLYADIGGAQRAGIHAVWIHRDRLELREGAPATPDRAVAHLNEVSGALLTTA